MADPKVDRFHKLLRMFDGSTTAGERVAAKNALDKHIAKYGDPRVRTKRRFSFPTRRNRIGHSLWHRIGPTPVFLYEVRTPSSKPVLLCCVPTTQRVRCEACFSFFPANTRMWTTTSDCAPYTGTCFCTSCLALDPILYQGATPPRSEPKPQPEPRSEATPGEKLDELMAMLKKDRALAMEHPCVYVGLLGVQAIRSIFRVVVYLGLLGVQTIRSFYGVVVYLLGIPVIRSIFRVAVFLKPILDRISMVLWYLFLFYVGYYIFITFLLP